MELQLPAPASRYTDFPMPTQTEHQRPPSGTLAAELRSLNAVDVKLHEYFTRRFDERVQSFGWARMRKELRLLKQRTEYWYQQCVARENDRRKNARQSLCTFRCGVIGAHRLGIRQAPRSLGGSFSSSHRGILPTTTSRSGHPRLPLRIVYAPPTIRHVRRRSKK
ncbi:hypothetical protein HPB49_001136 [Dermacentor silvarum]|uniref:Uncharacterized protein n=1 Tax=Dermacentor silvarum TaxID=543639 RepID=A0ACB8DM56_DERSI|nr:hypothetical protein HPB49_001136 [Dermacentor silvarum]